MIVRVAAFLPQSDLEVGRITEASEMVFKDYEIEGCPRVGETLTMTKYLLLTVSHVSWDMEWGCPRLVVLPDVPQAVALRALSGWTTGVE